MRGTPWMWVFGLACAEVEPEELALESQAPVPPGLAVDRTYVLDLSAVTYTNPPGIAAIAQGLLGGLSTERALTVLGTRPGEVLVRFGAVSGSPGARTQEMCALTTDVVLRNGPGDLFGGLGQGPLYGYMDGLDHTYVDYRMIGRLGPRAASIEEIRFSALWNAQRWTATIGSPVCVLVRAFGLFCQACPNGAQDCLDVAFEDGVATWDASLPPLREVTARMYAAAGCP